MLKSRMRGRDRMRELEVVARSERTIGELLAKARLRHEEAPSPSSEREVEELEHQHKLAQDLLDELRAQRRT